MSDASTAIPVIGKPADPMLPDGCTFATEDELRRWLLEWETGTDQPEPHQVRA